MDRELKVKWRVIKLKFINGHYSGTALAETLYVAHGILLFRNIQVHYNYCSVFLQKWPGHCCVGSNIMNVRRNRYRKIYSTEHLELLIVLLTEVYLFDVCLFLCLFVYSFECFSKTETNRIQYTIQFQWLTVPIAVCCFHKICLFGLCSTNDVFSADTVLLVWGKKWQGPLRSLELAVHSAWPQSASPIHIYSCP